MAKRKPNSQPFWRFAFLVYCALMLWLLFGRSSGWVEGQSYHEMLQLNTNIRPFYTINNYLRVLIHRTNDAMLAHCFINLAGNVLLFIPAGWLLPKLFAKQRNFFVFFFSCLVMILLIETLQLFTLLGSFDVDDVILNLAGMLLGFIYYHIHAAIRKRP